MKKSSNDILFLFKNMYWVKRSSFEWNMTMFSLKYWCFHFKKLTTWEREEKATTNSAPKTTLKKNWLVHFFLSEPIQKVHFNMGHPVVAILLRIIEIGWMWSSVFRTMYPSQKKCSQKLESDEKRIQFVRSFTKQIFRKFWWKLTKWQTFF